MGKSWKEKPGKYRYNKDFQKKQQKKYGNKPIYQDLRPIDIQSPTVTDYGVDPEYGYFD